MQDTVCDQRPSFAAADTLATMNWLNKLLIFASPAEMAMLFCWAMRTCTVGIAYAAVIVASRLVNVANACFGFAAIAHDQHLVSLLHSYPSVVLTVWPPCRVIWHAVRLKAVYLGQNVK
jgi:hypothetical protein